MYWTTSGLPRERGARDSSLSELRDTLQLQYVPTKRKSTLSKHGGGSSQYYDLPEGCSTVQDVIEAYDMDFTRGNLLKAVIRWEKKPNLKYNLEKIIWFAQDKLARMEDDDERSEAN